MSSGLQYCRGEMLSMEHWVELFRLLGMPKGMSLERLHFGDFINAQKMIIENFDALKSLNERAQGEVTFREAMHELELWAAQVNKKFLSNINSFYEFFYNFENHFK